MKRDPADTVTRERRHHYTFRSTWRLAASSDRVFGVLRDITGYSAWWPEVKRSHELHDGYADLALRSVLPFTLNFSLRRDLEDPDKGILRARADGDIVGTVEWRVSSSDAATAIADFSQVVELKQRLVRPIDPVVRPVLVWNHTAAMRSGERALNNYLSSES